MESIVICSDPGGGGDNGVMAMLILLTFVLATVYFMMHSATCIVDRSTSACACMQFS